MKNLILVVLIFTTGIVFSQDFVKVKVGDNALDFSVQTVEGEIVTLGNLYKNSPVVLVILRGWPGYQCPICTRQVGGLVADAEKFKKLGATVLMVYPGPAEQLKEYARGFSEGFEFPANFYFTLDPDYSVINKYGLRWDAPDETAYPSTFVMDKDGVIIFSKVSSDHGGRAENEEIFAALNNLSLNR